MEKFQVNQEAELLKYMQEIYPDRSRSAVKKMLQHGQFIIEGKPVTQFNYPLKKGQIVYVLSQKESKQIDYLESVSVIYEDRDLLAVEKESGLLSVPSENAAPGEDSAYIQVMGYVQSVDTRGEVFSVHRLDRETSGVMLFAKNKRTETILQENWSDLMLKRSYTAVVEGGYFPEGKGTHTSYIKELDNYQMISSPEDNGGKFAETKYEKIKSNALYSLVEAQLVTGRRNQIRLHMKDMGHPVAGDSKYGAASNPINRLALHAASLEVIHPITEEELVFESQVPGSFLNLVSE